MKEEDNRKMHTAFVRALQTNTTYILYFADSLENVACIFARPPSTRDRDVAECFPGVMSCCCATESKVRLNHAKV